MSASSSSEPKIGTIFKQATKFQLYCKGQMRYLWWRMMAINPFDIVDLNLFHIL